MFSRIIITVKADKSTPKIKEYNDQYQHPGSSHQRIHPWLEYRCRRQDEEQREYPWSTCRKAGGSQESLGPSGCILKARLLVSRPLSIV